MKEPSERRTHCSSSVTSKSAKTAVSSPLGRFAGEKLVIRLLTTQSFPEYNKWALISRLLKMNFLSSIIFNVICDVFRIPNERKRRRKLKPR